MTAPLRVAVVARSVYPLHGVGGLERHVSDLVRHLSDGGVEVHLITRPPTAEPGASLGARVRLHTVPYRTFPYAGRRGTTVLDRSTAYPLFGERAGRLAWRLARDGAIDIVHGLGASVLGYARRRADGGVPLVLNPQGLEEFGATDPSRARLKRAAYLPLRLAVLACARAADRVIATDRALVPAVRRHLHVEPDRIVTIPNAVDLAAIDALGTAGAGIRRRDLGVPDAALVLLSVGRLEENKGFHVLARALAALRDHGGVLAGRPWRWVIAGEGPYRSRLAAAVRAAGIEDHTLFAGRPDELTLHAWYRTADLFVHPTLYEGSSLVTLEAMAHRRTVVASAAGGLPDKVVPGVTGWLVPPGDPGALAAAVSGALAPGIDRAAMGEAGRALVESAFSWTAAAAATRQLYETLLAEAIASPGNRR